MLDLQVMSAMLNHPEGGGQPGDCQTKSEVQALNPGYSLLEHHHLSEDKPGHDEPRHYRRQYALFAACEDQHNGDKRTSSNANCQYDGGDGVIAERRVL